MDDERPPGPRDWEPTDPHSPWWNPRPGDAYGPSDEELRQPWERQPPVRRFCDPWGSVPGPVIHEPPASSRPPTLPPQVTPARKPAKKEPEREFSSLTSFMGFVVMLAIVVLILACAVGVFAKGVRAGAWVTVFYAGAVTVEALVISGAGTAVRAWAGRGRSWVVRFALLTLAAVTVLLHPAGVALIVMRDSYVPGVYGSAAALVLAAAVGIPAALRHPIYAIDRTATESTAADPTAR